MLIAKLARKRTVYLEALVSIAVTRLGILACFGGVSARRAEELEREAS